MIINDQKLPPQKIVVIYQNYALNEHSRFKNRAAIKLVWLLLGDISPKDVYVRNLFINYVLIAIKAKYSRMAIKLVWLSLGDIDPFTSFST